ncbi:uncharacterized protein N0V89_007406 [Didymosphaeria variabile]|uniref:F-box domain-containing protein n=1 Tax=Didymosphaeria variabile TaxID=1932322 RepID=A0A9W9CA53_9PLEO|nr:uncharacterized protein N0V89_007406 [Didymosphaeria variabile]KAJ4352060.1 hypothetical protein N0V89_007406 [Didymosphaeria variabile]
MQASTKSSCTGEPSENQNQLRDRSDAELKPAFQELDPYNAPGGPSSRDDKHYDSTTLPLISQKTNPVVTTRSHANLQQLLRGESIKTTMENINLSLGRSSSRRLSDRSGTYPVRARPDHRETESTIVPSRVIFEPSVGTNSAPPTSAAPTAQPLNPIANFEGLPGELRNYVYHLLFADCPTTLALRENRLHNLTAVPDRKPYLKLLPGLAYTNRGVYNEIATVFLQDRTMEISVLADLYYLEDVLEQLPGQKGWNSVKCMEFTRFADLATSPARTRELFDCIARCRNVEQLTLQIKLDLLHMPEHGAAYRQLAFLNGTPGVKTPEQVAANYELDLLFDLPRLRKLTMICEWHRDGPVRCTPRTMATFWDLQDWIAQGFTTKADNIKEVFKLLPFNDSKQLGAWTVRLQRGQSNNAV